MTPSRFDQITSHYPDLDLVVLGDFCLDRYLEIDPGLEETSIETGRPVHNVVRVRAQPGGAGTVLNNLVSLGVRSVAAIGFSGDDAEGYELLRAMRAHAAVQLDGFLTTALRRTFTYCKPLVLQPNRPPVELDRLDSRNWSLTPPEVSAGLVQALTARVARAHAVVVVDQVDVEGTGVVTRQVRAALGAIQKCRPDLLILADCRRGLATYPSVTYKMNLSEMALMLAGDLDSSPPAVGRAAAEIAGRSRHAVFVTLAEAGILAASPDRAVEHRPALPTAGPIDVVGAGDAVTANLACALASGASIPEALEFANAAASAVVHQLGTTGAATVALLRTMLACD